MAHPDLPAEQAYVDGAYVFLERMRAAVERASSAVDGEVAALAVEAWARRRLATFGDAEQGLCFGRLDLDEARLPLYVGRRWVHDEEQRAVVVNWQAPAARPRRYENEARSALRLRTGGATPFARAYALALGLQKPGE